MIRFALLALPAALAALLLAPHAPAEPKAAAGPKVDFNREIRPILSNACFACHGPDEKVRKADLRLDTREGAVADGGIVPGKPDDSTILKRILSDDPTEVMPPPKHGKKLGERDVATLRRWIEQGAPYATHWSYVKPERPQAPEIAGGKNPVDAFLLERLAKEGLSFQPEADRYTLARRAALALTGLPPTPEELTRFVDDKAADAYEQYVDRLLAKPSFGEHWARMWLDLARYADSAGYADDPSRTIWAYRDYVIKSFNDNKPFDRFTIEQLAGDLLPNPTEEQLTATAFHRNTLTNNEGGTSDEEFRNVAVVDRVNTTFAVWMGTSMACAQCHTHKYDPIAQTEYFQLFAFLNNTEDADRRDESPLLSLFSDEQKRQKADWEKELLAVKERLANPPATVAAGQKAWEAAFPKEAAFAHPNPLAAKAKSGAAIEVRPDGSLFIPKSGGKADTYTVELPLVAGKLTAVRLETKPDAKLPGGGAGHASGNFVVTNLTATVVPDGNKPLAGRYIRVELPGKKTFLMLAEVQAFSGNENVAPKGVAKQSSTAFGGVASRANDGKTDGHYFEGNSVSHTFEQDDPWWELDLKVNLPLDRIAIWPRTDGGGERLANFKVQFLDADRKPVWEQTVVKTPKPSTTLALSPTRPVAFASAFADFSQPKFDAATALSGDKNKGWAVGGAVDQPHALTLLPGTPVEVSSPGKLVLTIEQNSTHADHTLGSFRIGVSTDPAAATFARTPRAVLGALRVDAEKRTAAEAKAIADFYRTVAPETKVDRDRLAVLEKSLAEMKPTTTVPIFRELPKDRRRVTKVQLRGNFLDTGATVTEGVPAAWPPLPKDAPRDRLALARWLVDPANPLTARVTANRFWEELFGTGLVRTSEEFGSQGELPSHPELLDWLATELVRQKWDVKAFLKLLVTSAAYRQSSKVTPAALEKDPDNRLLSRGPRFRLSAETVRDHALAVAGLLSDKMYGPSVRPARPSAGLSAAFGGGLDWQTSTGADKYRRGLYTEWRRTSPYPSMSTFDAPSREACTIRRVRTNTPLQALVTLNDPVYVEAAQSLARKMDAAGKTPAEKAAWGLRACLCRPATDAETKRLLALYDDARATYAKDPAKAAKLATNPLGPLPAGSDAVELAAWTTVANVLMNLDEMLMRR